MVSSLEQDQADPFRAGFYKGMEVRQNDEYGRLRRQHLLHKTVMNDKLIRVPLPHDSRSLKILDSGTGDGLWMLDASDEYPNATFVGTDLFAKHFEQIQNLMPPNISFKVQNLLDDWPTEDDRAYDLVHQRYCLAQFTEEKDNEITKNMWNLVKPGGYIQFVEADMMSFEGGENHSGLTRFMAFVNKAFPQAKMNHRPGPGIKHWLENAGASGVQEEVFAFKMGAAATSEEMRKATTENMNAIISNFAMVGSSEFFKSPKQDLRIDAISGWPNYWYTPEDFKILADEVGNEMETTGNTWKFWLVTAKKASSG